MASINCLTHFSNGEDLTSSVKYNCDGKVSEAERKNDFGVRAINYGKFDVATESVGAVSAEHFNPKTFTCLLMLDDGNKYRTNRKMLFYRKWKSVGMGIYVHNNDVFYSVAWM